MTHRPSCLGPALLTFAASMLLCLPLRVQAAGAHEHGAVKLNIAIEGATLNLDLEMPLDSLVGFERAPRTPAEKQKIEAAVTRLRAVNDWFKTAPAAGCHIGTVTLTAPVIGVGASAPTPATNGHADLDGEFSLSCQAIKQLQQAEITLFAAFPGIKRIDVQWVTPQGQHQQRLTPSSRQLQLQR